MNGKVLPVGSPLVQFEVIRVFDLDGAPMDSNIGVVWVERFPTGSRQLPEGHMCEPRFEAVDDPERYVAGGGGRPHACLHMGRFIE